MNESTRTVEVFLDDKWVKTEMCDLEPGNLIRLFEPSGEPVKDAFTGETEFYVNSEPDLVVNENNVETYCVNVVTKKEWDEFVDQFSKPLLCD